MILQKTLPFFYALLLFGVSFSAVGSAVDTPTITAEQGQNGVVVHNGSEMLRLTVCGPSVIHVVAGPVTPKPRPRHPPDCERLPA